MSILLGLWRCAAKKLLRKQEELVKCITDEGKDPRSASWTFFANSSEHSCRAIPQNGTMFLALDSGLLSVAVPDWNKRG